MISNTLAAAFVLLSLNFSNVSVSTSVGEPTVIEAPAMEAQKLSQVTLRKILEDHAAPHWSLSMTEVWTAYYDGLLSITEITPEEHYFVHYNSGILELVLEQDQG
ncbi:MAG: hypothetical protein AAGN35_13470 [Bacteroidota bacterium]